MRSLGFPNLAPQPSQSITPKPTKPKGRLLFGFIIICSFGFVAYHVWDAYFRHSAYGIVTAKVIEVSAPYNGVITSLHVKEGERVVQGQVLAVIENIDFRNEYECSRDKLSLASAELNAQVAKLKLEYAFRLDSNIGTVVNYYELVGKAAQEKARYEETRDIYRRSSQLLKEHSIAQQEVNVVRFAMLGHYKTLQELNTAVIKAKERMDKIEKVYGNQDVLNGWQEQISPLLVRVENAKAELERARVKLEVGNVTSPVSGIVVKRCHHIGEQCYDKPLFSIIQDNTYYVTMYVTQEDTNEFKVGQLIELRTPTGKVDCIIERIGDTYEHAPDSLKRYYKVSQNLLPIHMKINGNSDLKYGATLKLPYFRS